MKLSEYTNKPQTLHKWIEQTINSRGEGTTLIFEDPDGETEIKLTTLMTPIKVEANYLNDDEFMELEDLIFEEGYSSFLNLDQIEDIVDNLTMQKEKYTDEELLKSINFYFTRDAFYDYQQ